MFQNHNALVNSSARPKAETVDPEIDKIAEQIREANSKKMVQKQTVVISTIQKKTDADVNSPTAAKSCDWNSVQGQFGWEQIGKEVLPYILRSDEKYISDKMAKYKLLFQYNVIFTNEIWEYTPLKMVPATKAEAKLLEEINKKHCDGFYGNELFTDKDLIYPLQDAVQLHDYLSFCYMKITKSGVTDDQRCGFIKIINDDKINLVPYVLAKGNKFVPVFYFDGDCDYLEKGAVELKGWDLAYLKFVCKIQGIRRVLYDKEMVEVVELEYLKKFFLPGTKFEIGWEIDTLNKSDLLKTTEEIDKIVAQYTMTPSQHKQAKKSDLKMQVPHAKNIPQTGPYQRYRPGRPNYATNYNQQSPQVQPQPTFRQQMPYQQRVPQVYPTQYDPRQNSAMQNGFSDSSVRQYTLVPNINTNNGQQKYYQIPEVTNCNQTQYFLSTRDIDGKTLVGCINMEPFSPANPLVSIEELSASLFRMDMKLVKNAINVMRLDVYRPNSQQLNVLRSINLANTEGLVKLSSLYENLTQIKYILGIK